MRQNYKNMFKTHNGLFLRILIAFVLFLTTGKMALSQSSEHSDSLVQLFYDKNIPFIDKYYMSADMDFLSHEQMLEVFNVLLPEAKQYDDKAPVMKIHAMISNLYSILNRFDMAKAYLDSAFFYEPLVDNHVILGVSHYIAGQYYANQAQHSLSHPQFYKAMEYFDVAGIPIFTELYSDLSAAYRHLKDTANMKKLVDRISSESYDRSLIDEHYNNVLENSIKAGYYGIMYDTKGEEALLDSMEYYTRKAINEFLKAETPVTGLAYEVASNYMDMAKIFLCKKTANSTDSALYYAAEAKRLSNPQQQMIPVAYHGIAGEIYCFENQWDKAEKEYMTQLELLQSIPQLAVYSEYAVIYERLSLVNEKQGKYKDALHYANLCLTYMNLLFDHRNYQTIQELQTRYEVSKKEADIQRLTELNQYQERIRLLTLGILALIVMAAILGFLWFRRKRKSDADALQIARLERQEAELKAEMEAAKLEEKELQFDALSSEMEKRQIRSYLDGLEAERERLASELHDNVSNSLFGVELKMHSSDVSKEEITGLLHGIQEHVRNISHALMPPVFQYATLAEIIIDYVYMQNGMKGPRFECDIQPEDGWDDLPHETALELHRIVQESCGNALKHADASLINIALHRNDNGISLIVNDNGIGMDTNRRKQGLGLQIIRDRAAKMNGTIEIISVPENGTTIKVTV